MTLTEAEKKFGVPIDILKKYVSFGFIKACQTTCGASDYCEKDFERLGLIDILLNTGFSPEETRKYLDLTENIGTNEEQIRMLRKKRRGLLNDIHRKQQLLDHLDFMIWEKKIGGKIPMIYRTFNGISLSALGFGAMRLPVIDGDENSIDENSAFEMIDYAMAHGVNYYDTAWPYHGGNSEIVLGKALKRYRRDSFFLATKFPGGNLSNMDKVEEIFEKQLEKLQVDYLDFYLFHNVCERNIDAYLDPKYGIYEYLKKQRDAGRIHHLGFSAHGDLDVLKRFLDAYGGDMEFCQIQLNYIDWELQRAKAKVELLNSYHIPVWVMEPLRGGRLAKLGQGREEKLKAFRPDEGIPAWGFRFLQSIPEVKMILSGMSDMEQLKDNIATFETDRPLSEEEKEVLLEIAHEMTSEFSVPCTACRYCTSECPRGLDIPSILALYNDFSFSKGGFVAPMVISTMPKDKIPSACIGCRSCEAACPQQIRISEIMADFSQKLKL